MKLAAAIIVKPTDEEAKMLDRCLRSFSDDVDGIFITITGENSECQKVAEKYGAVISHFDWIQDFAAARNFNFSQVPKEFTHIFWCDADDIIMHPELLRECMTNSSGADIILMNYEYAFDEFRNCIAQHAKTRIVKNDGCVTWVGELHEDFFPNRALVPALEKKIWIRHMTNNARIEEGTARNLAIAEKALKEKPLDPRSYWLMANASIMANKPQDAKRYLLRFIKTSKSDEEKFLAHIRLVDIYLDEKDHERATKQALKAIALKAIYPNGWTKLADVAYAEGKWRNAEELIRTALTKQPVSGIVNNPLDQTFNPKLLLAKALIEQNKDEEALKYLKECYAIRRLKSLEVLMYGLEHPQTLIKE